MDLVEILSFLFQLSFSTLGKVSRGLELGGWVGEPKESEVGRGNVVMGQHSEIRMNKARPEMGKEGVLIQVGRREWNVFWTPAGYFCSTGLLCGRYE